jgi:threonine dehydrogenase-like Zn-dependent dehydrogenase
MLALRWHGTRDVRVEEIPVPAITEPKDVIYKVTGTTICGSDLHSYRKEITQLQNDEVLGHEWMGVVEKVLSEVK